MDTILMGITAIFAGLITGVNGGGGGFLFTAVATRFMTLQEAIILGGFVGCVSQCVSVAILRKHIRWGITLWLGLPCVVFGKLGAEMLFRLPPTLPRFLLLIFCLIFVASCFRKDREERPHKRSRVFLVAAGSVGGFLTGITRGGGLLRARALQSSLALTVNESVATCSFIAFLQGLVQCETYSPHLTWTAHLFCIVAVYCFLAVCGVLVGQLVLSKNSSRVLKIIQCSIVAACAAFLLFPKE